MSSLQVQAGFPMLSGVGAASYAVNSGPPNSVLLRCRPILAEAIALHQASLLQLMNRSSGNNIGELTAGGIDIFRIADMGSSSGPNCLANMHFMVEVIKKCNPDLDSATTSHDHRRQLQCFFCDLPSNDFNTLFWLLHTQYPQLRDELGCSTAAVAGTVYGRLFPTSSLHFVFSSLCLQWLSQVPQSVSMPGTREWNRGKIWVDGPLAKEATGRAYATQWQQDFVRFLKARKQELVNGGMMFLVIMCRPDSFPPHRMQEESSFRNLELSWQQLIQEGVIENEDLDTFNIPVYLPNSQEIRNALQSMPELRMQSLEVIEEPIGDNYWRQWRHDPCDWAERADNFYRSIFWNVIEGHVGTMKCEAIFNRFQKLLKESLQKVVVWDSYWAYPWSLYAIVQIVKEI